jgi:hypothetical protein
MIKLRNAPLFKSVLFKLFIAVSFAFSLLITPAPLLPQDDANTHFDIHNARARQKALIDKAMEDYKNYNPAGDPDFEGMNKNSAGYHKKAKEKARSILDKRLKDIRVTQNEFDAGVKSGGDNKTKPPEFVNANNRRIQKIDSLLSGLDPDNSGSIPKTIGSDFDATLKTNDPDALKEIVSRAKGKNYTVVQQHKYKVYIKELDATVWVQPPDVSNKKAFEDYVRTMVNDPDAFPTAGGLEYTSRPKDQSKGVFGAPDPEGAVLSNVHKANHALKGDASGKVDLHTAAKSLSKAAEISGVKNNMSELRLELENAQKAGDAYEVKRIETEIKVLEKSDFWKKVEDLRGHKTPAEAGIIDPRDPPSKQKKDMEKFIGEMNEKLKQSHFEGARRGRDNINDLEKKLAEAQKAGDAKGANKIKNELDAIKISNSVCKEEISKSNPELKKHIKGVDEELDAKDKTKKDKPPAEDSKTKPDDGSKPPDDGSKPPDDGSKPPDDGSKPPDDGSKPPDDGTKPPDDGTKPPDDGTKPPQDDGKAKTDDGKTKTDDGKTKPPDDGGKTSDDGRTPPADDGKTKPDDSKTKTSGDGTKPPDGGGTRPPDTGDAKPVAADGTPGDGPRPPDSGSKRPDSVKSTSTEGSDAKTSGGADTKTKTPSSDIKVTPDAPKPIVRTAPPKKGAFGPSVETPKTNNIDLIKSGAMDFLSGLQGGGDFSNILKDELHKAIKEGRDPNISKVLIWTTIEIGKGEFIGAAVGWAGGFAGSYIAGAAGAAWGGPIAVGVFVGGMVIYEIGTNGVVDGLGNLTGLRAIGDLIYTDWEHEFITEDQLKHLRAISEAHAEKQIKQIREMKKLLKTGADPKKIDEYKKLIEKTYKNYQSYIKMGGSPNDPAAKALREAIENAGDLNNIPRDIKHGDPTFIQADREEADDADEEVEE